MKLTKTLGYLGLIAAVLVGLDDYFLFTGLAGSIALITTIMQLTGHAECPKTTSDIPMCFYSLLPFSRLIILKTTHIKSKSNT